MIDYVLVVAVGISAGVGALVSAAPSLQPRTLSICILVLIVITPVNLRGVRETGLLFIAPTYLFVGCLLLAITVGVIKSVLSHLVPLFLFRVYKVHRNSWAMVAATSLR
jgi:amino acid transporter